MKLWFHSGLFLNNYSSLELFADLLNGLYSLSYCYSNKECNNGKKNRNFRNR